MIGKTRPYDEIKGKHEEEIYVIPGMKFLCGRELEIDPIPEKPGWYTNRAVQYSSMYKSGKPYKSGSWRWHYSWFSEIRHEHTKPDNTDTLLFDEYDRAGLAMAKFLRHKNKNYGDSVNKPMRVFGSKSLSEEEAFFVRMNDKISRITNGPDEPRENDITDLEGYLMLYRIHKGWINLDHMID